MSILQQLQKDLLEQNIPLSNTLRKAMVLAHHLTSETLKNWASQELNGYKSSKDLPDYRKLNTSCVGKWTNGYWLVSNQPVPLWKIDHPKLVEALTNYYVFDGIRTIEQLAVNQQLKYFLPAEMLALVNQYVMEDGYGFMEVRHTVGHHQFEQILDTVKNRLLDFVLELDANWNIEQNVPPKRELEHLVSVYIYNNPQGGNMAVFDQRGQFVNYQYNAAGDINIGAVQNRLELVDELVKLKTEFDRAVQYQLFDEEVAIEADSKLKLAVAEAKKPEPNKRTLMERINSAKALIEGVAAAGGLVTALVKAAELVQKLF